MIQLCNFRNTIHQRTGIGTIGSVMEHPVLLAQTKCPDGTLNNPERNPSSVRRMEITF